MFRRYPALLTGTLKKTGLVGKCVGRKCEDKLMHRLLGTLLVLGYLVFPASAMQDPDRLARVAGDALYWHMNNGRTRPVFEALPKGGDIHNHLRGAIYAETWLEWAAEDGLCADMYVPALRFDDGRGCDANGWITAADALRDEGSRRALINALSTRSYVPTNGWSGHNQFFATFARINAKAERLGDQLAAVAQRAGKQNILYLELMETVVLPQLFPLVNDVEMTGDPIKDYQALLNSPFGQQLDTLTEYVQTQLREAEVRKRAILNCDTDRPKVGCDVTIRFLHQVVREFEPAVVYAQMILGWSVMETTPEVVGLNLVAPEDGYIALRDYSLHMRMLDQLYTNRSHQNISLHAGELTLGIVRPRQLRFHIREAIEIGHAKRIGHGVAIDYEDNHLQLLEKMVEDGILVEINLTSNDVILGVAGANHPITLYRDMEVPYTISTDDEGVSRIDLTHEYIRLAQTYDVPYFELRHVSRNSLTYSFLDGESLWESDVCVSDLEGTTGASAACEAFLTESEKATLQWKLEQKFKDFEATLKIPEQRRNSFN